MTDTRIFTVKVTSAPRTFNS